MVNERQRKQLFERVGRTFFMLFSRASMYTISHPFTTQAQDDFFQVITMAVQQASPLVFIMNREQFFIEEDPFDPRINPERLVVHFKKAGIESIAFEKGINKPELSRFLRIFINIKQYTTADAMIASLNTNSVRHIKINHVIFRKMTKEDEVVSKDRLDALPEKKGGGLQQTDWEEVSRFGFGRRSFEGI